MAKIISMVNHYANRHQHAVRGQIAQAVGIRAEAVAEAALISNGARILLRRARTACGEVDLVAQHRSQLCFIEVKHRLTWAEAVHSLTKRQQERIIRAAEIILADNPAWIYDSISFDVIAVNKYGIARRIKNAFYVS